MNRSALLLLGLAAQSSCRKSTPPADPERVAEPLPAASSPIVQHCLPPTSAPFVLKSSAAKSSELLPNAADDNPTVLPFAAEVGGGTRWSGGFALGAIYAPEGSPTLAIVTLGADGQRAKVVPIGTARGDADPPHVAGHGEEVIFGILEPQPNGRSLRVGKIKADAVLWGATLPSRSGESQAFDLGVGERVLLAWDEEHPSGSVIQVATLDPHDLGNATPARTISPPDRDSDSPRLLSRPGGYWLAYIARSEVEPGEDAPYAAENVGFRWVELVPLDQAGFAVGKPRNVTPTDGHVMLFDLGPGGDGSAIVVWRELDTSTGSGGGKIMRVVARAGTIEPPAVLVESEVGTGAPSLVGRWLAITDTADATRLAPISPLGELQRPPAPEPEVGNGEPIASTESAILVVRPLGRDMRLSVVRCRAEESDAAPQRGDPLP